MLHCSNCKYLAFDLETAKRTVPNFADWRSHRPLGICCAATFEQDGEPRVWHSLADDGRPAPCMTRADACRLVAYLCDAVAQGFTLVTWNGAGFDFDILAEESGCFEECRRCADHHIDMMFHLVCLRGRGVKLQKAAEGLALPGKTALASEVPTLWANGEFERVFTYAQQDVRLTLQIALLTEQRSEFAWISTEGERKTLPLPGGWLRVCEAMRLPLPDTSQLEVPRKREDYIGWMLGKEPNGRAGNPAS